MDTAAAGARARRQKSPVTRAYVVVKTPCCTILEKEIPTGRIAVDVCLRADLLFSSGGDLENLY
jgi:hypothetical protein